MEIVAQSIQKAYNDKLSIAEKYYRLLFDVNNMEVTDIQMQMIAYCAVRGTLSTPPIRDGFLERYKIAKGTFYNNIGKLLERKLLVKHNKKIRVNPVIMLDWTKDEFIFKISLKTITEK